MIREIFSVTHIRKKSDVERMMRFLICLYTKSIDSFVYFIIDILFQNILLIPTENLSDVLTKKSKCVIDVNHLDTQFTSERAWKPNNYSKRICDCDEWF